MNAAEQDDPRAVASDPAVEQLQRAAQKMIDASRDALDALEVVISDRQRMGEVVSSFTEVIDRVGRTLGDLGSRGASGESGEPEAETDDGGDEGRAPRIRRIRLDEDPPR